MRDTSNEQINNLKKRMEAETGTEFTDPREIISQLEIKEGGAAADFGCGSGYFSIPFAQAVGDEGKVYCLDILPQALESVESQAKILGISNIFTKRANLENENGSGLEDNSMDWVIMKDVLFQNEKKKNILKEAYRILKPEGRVLIMEWGDNLLVGPDKEKRVPREEIERLADEQGFIIKKNIPAGDFHYAIVVEK